ncbi:LacI family transcriptional regulator [Amylibacter kogurei]|uniref:LacI family transcriptional regulator n=1 Tax=Paramylibacter kogurei TaxID=1889778 RepID=A0A2G5K819_9RHOB|nr:LacI family DNA-binding transcriptional regulator [Amylibacter kogurei]PIB25585.1 LacI family transcriptional regulator [Amylibacter kogurei]
MAKRPTIKDLANAANVGVATVDRVLNARANVRPEMVDLVIDAAERIGYPTRAMTAHRDATRLPLVRFGFVLHKGSQEFYQNFSQELRAAISERKDIRAKITFRFSSSQSPDDFAKEIRIAAQSSDIIATSAINHPSLTEIVSDLRDSGTSVFALLNDFAQGMRQNYFGLNNVKVGRIAGWMMATAIPDPGKLAIFVGGNRWHGHLLRETGFQSYIREIEPKFNMLDTVVNLETRQVTYEATLDLLDRHPDLRGIYVAGGGMEGAIAAMREKRPPNKVALVVNELTEESRRALSDGYVNLVIATPLSELCHKLVDVMIKSAQGDPDTTTSQHFFTPQLFVPESF